MSRFLKSQTFGFLLAVPVSVTSAVAIAYVTLARVTQFQTATP